MSVRALTALATIIATTILTIPAAATAKTLPITLPASSAVGKVKETQQEKRLKSQQKAQLHKAAIQIGELRKIAWSCQDTLIRNGLRKSRTTAATDIWSLPPSVKYRTKYVAPLWVKLAKGCQQNLRDHTIPNIQDWPMAVKWVQKIYPDTADWMMYISDREGGWGRWVWYGGRLWGGAHIGNDFLGADTVGGWLQFRYSTFAPYWRAALENLRSRGYIVPNFKMPPPGGDPRYAAWLNPMGQALTAGFMKYYHKEGCHWCL